MLIVNLNQGLIVDIFLSFQLFITANQPGAEPDETKEQRRGWLGAAFQSLETTPTRL